MTNWVGLVLGFWVLVSPWLLGFSSISIMKWSNLLVGLVLVLMNTWIIFGEKKSLKADSGKAGQ
ncbi:MAG: SPW repeat protein [Candidatus Liptonbacteria bacterium]|nr:SPW repeat protein [Candidatus Liptonbacteria bacterium]